MYLLYVSACIDSLLSLSTTLGNSQVRFHFLDGLRVNSAGGEHQGQITSNSRLHLAQQWEAILQYLHGIQKSVESKMIIMAAVRGSSRT